MQLSLPEKAGHLSVTDWNYVISILQIILQRYKDTNLVCKYIFCSSESIPEIGSERGVLVPFTVEGASGDIIETVRLSAGSFPYFLSFEIFQNIWVRFFDSGGRRNGLRMPSGGQRPRSGRKTLSGSV